ncbi:unnamed protein product [Lactuca virosa]|nr:unnamed protein product [Lactuca virosa]
MNSSPLKCFASGVLPDKLPIALVNLRVLNVSGLCFAKEVDLCCALLLVTSSSNIEKIKMEMCYTSEVVSQSAMNLIDLVDYCNVTLDNLRELEMRNMGNMKPEMDFVKLILGNSPMLKKVGIVIDNRVAVNAEVKMLRELLQYQRASTNAKIIFERQ